MNIENPITFTEPSFILFNVTRHAVCMTPIGHLAVFTTKNIAEACAKSTHNQIGDEIIVLRVQIAPLDSLPL